MKTYQFESIIEENGTIVLPKEIKKLKKHRIKLTLVDLETIQQNPVKLLHEITQKYNNIVDESELDIAEIYKRREQKNGRSSMFT
ncbi:MAG: hypothetical protein ACUZ8E_03900 [Candidatus Anammoxibacter sp.]